MKRKPYKKIGLKSLEKILRNHRQSCVYSRVAPSRPTTLLKTVFTAGGLQGPTKRIFRTLPNIYDGVFCEKSSRVLVVN